MADLVIKHLFQDIEEMKRDGTTMSEAVYAELVSQKGYYIFPTGAK